MMKFCYRIYFKNIANNPSILFINITYLKKHLSKDSYHHNIVHLIYFHLIISMVVHIAIMALLVCRCPVFASVG